MSHDHTKQYIVFTDLDGTLLDSNYSCHGAELALLELRQKKIPLIFCSGKTLTEQQWYRQKLGVSDPFIIENGAAIVIPQGYFSFDYDYDRMNDSHYVIELGRPYSEIVSFINQLKKQYGWRIKGLNEMSAEDVSKLTGLELEAAKRAKIRDYDETLLVDESVNELAKLAQEAGENGFRLTHGGMWYHITGANDKGMAVKKLTNLFKCQYSNVTTIGLGDSRNDVEFLEAVDIPIVMPQQNGDRLLIRNPNRIIAPSHGPKTWAEMVTKIIS